MRERYPSSPPLRSRTPEADQPRASLFSAGERTADRRSFFCEESAARPPSSPIQQLGLAAIPQSLFVKVACLSNPEGCQRLAGGRGAERDDTPGSPVPIRSIPEGCQPHDQAADGLLTGCWHPSRVQSLAARFRGCRCAHPRLMAANPPGWGIRIARNPLPGPDQHRLFERLCFFNRALTAQSSVCSTLRKPRRSGNQPASALINRNTVHVNAALPGSKSSIELGLHPHGLPKASSTTDTTM